MTGSSLPLARQLGQVARSSARAPGYLSSGFWSVTRLPPRTSRSAARMPSGVAPKRLQDLGGLVPAAGHRQQQVLGREVLVLEFLHRFLGVPQDLAERAGDADFRLAADLGGGFQLALGSRGDGAGVGAEALRIGATMPSS